MSKNSQLGFIKPHYKYEVPNNTVLFRHYGGAWDDQFAHGYLGNIYVLWLMAIFALRIGMLTGLVQLSFLSILIPVSFEAIVVVVSLGAVIYMTYRSEQSAQHIVRMGEQNFKYKRATEATISRANANNDLSLFIAAVFFVIAQLPAMIVFATGGKVTPVPVDNSTASAIPYLNGSPDNYNQIIRPDVDGNINLYYVFLAVDLVKSLILFAIYFYRGPVVTLHDKLNLLDKYRDDNGDVPLDQFTKGQTASQAPLLNA